MEPRANMEASAEPDLFTKGIKDQIGNDRDKFLGLLVGASYLFGEQSEKRINLLTSIGRELGFELPTETELREFKSKIEGEN